MINIYQTGAYEVSVYLNCHGESFQFNQYHTSKNACIYVFVSASISTLIHSGNAINNTVRSRQSL